MLLGSAQSDTTSAPRSESSVDASSNSNAYNASLKPLKSKPPERQLLDQAGDMLPAEAIMEQFDRAQQYVLKNRGEFTAEQQDKLQVRHQTPDVLHEHRFVVSVSCVSHSLTGPSSTCSRTGATSLLIKLQVRHRTAERLHGHTFFPVYLFVHFVYYSVIYLLTYLPCTYVELLRTPAERAQQYIELSQGERLSLCCDSMTNADML